MAIFDDLDVNERFWCTWQARIVESELGCVGSEARNIKVQVSSLSSHPSAYEWALRI